MFNTVDDLRNSRAIIREFWEKYQSIGDIYTINDIVVISILHRMSEIDDAFNELTKENDFNYIAAAPLLRVQIDNLLYCHAGGLVEDLNDFYKCFLSGQNWNKIKDREGNELTEKYLLDRLSNIVYKSNELRRIYKEASDFVHYSDDHIKITFRRDPDTGERWQTIGEFDYTDEHHQNILDIMKVLNQLIMHEMITTWVPCRKENIRIIKELKAKYPDKSEQELFDDFGYNDDRVIKQFFKQLRQK